jgi:hypothetical protein
MDCAQHTGMAAVAYCCSCGKPLCELCKRDVQGAIFCEPCLAARVYRGANYSGNYPPHAPVDTSPELALFLGFIPGVGAFYNGQFLKGFVHVMVLSMLIFLSDHGMGGVAGLLIAAWFFYMVFDAYTTAKARRYGLPIPDPIGLNAILEGHDGTVRQRVEQAAERFGANVEHAAQNIGQHWRQAGGATPGDTASNVPGGDVAARDAASATQAAAPGEPPPPPQDAANVAPDAGPSGAANVGAGGTYYSGPQGTYYAPPGYVAPREPERCPVGAVVLIGLGVLFLLSNLGWFSFFWIRHYWPVLLIVMGLWLFIKRQRGTR